MTTDDRGDGPMGSTCTMCSHDCTTALINDVLPNPQPPATKTLRRPMALPSAVNGRREGILMLGMISCGELPLPSMSVFSWSSSPSLSSMASSFPFMLCV